VQVPPSEIFSRIENFFAARIAALEAAGIARSRLILDPGMGFFLSSDPETSFTVLRRLPELRARFGLPLLKRFDQANVARIAQQDRDKSDANAHFRHALEVAEEQVEDIQVVTSGAGAAGTAIIRLLIAMGLKKVIMCDRKGAIYEGREDLNAEKADIARLTNREKKQGSLKEVIVGADVFIGVSAPGALTKEMVQTMAKDPIIFACANPTPEIFPDEAKAGGAAVVATGRSDFPNQVNNVLAFPGIFRGALDVLASDINDEMKIAAAYALADLVTEEELCADYVLPAAFDPRVGPAVAKAVAQAARDSGVARK
jgi:malate dehydrogenase (oxaloacetate-decarboxylating)